MATSRSGAPAPTERTGRNREGVPTGPQGSEGPAGRHRTRPSPADLAAAVAERRTVPDLVGPDLAILFCGINPGRWSGAVGHHFAHPGNRFWKLLHAAGLTPGLLAPAEERRLLDHGLGVTNLVTRTTATAAELTPEELRDGARHLERTVAKWRPAMVAVLGLGAYRAGFGRPRATVGAQPEDLGPSGVWVLPNPSGLQGHYRFEDMVAELRRLRAAARRRAVGDAG